MTPNEAKSQHIHERFMREGALAHPVDIRWLTPTTFEACVILELCIDDEEVQQEHEVLGVLESGKIHTDTLGGHGRIDDEVRAAVIEGMMDEQARADDHAESVAGRRKFGPDY